MSAARIVAFCVLMFWLPLVQAESIKLAVAANFATTMQELAAEFEKESDHKVSLSFASTGKLYAQIQNGAPFHAFFSADQHTAERLATEGKALAASRFTYATGALVLWSPKVGLVNNTPDLLQQGNFKKLALANPKLAPYGLAAVEVLQKLNLEDATAAKWVQGENIAQTFQFVFTENADLGFVALSQVMEGGKIKGGSYWLVPDSFHSPLHQDALILLPGKDSAATHDFLAFVRSSRGKTIIESYGYKTAPGE